MRLFGQIADRVLAYLAGFYFLTLIHEESFQTVLAALCSVACVSFCAAMGRKKITLLICTGYFVASLFAGRAFPCLLPSMLYELACVFPEKLPWEEKRKYMEKEDICGMALVVIFAGSFAVSACLFGGDLTSFLSNAMVSGPQIGVFPFVAAELIVVCLAYRTRMVRVFREKLDRLEDEGRGAAFQMERWKEDSRQKQDAEVHAATLAERNRIAREIHDNVGHSLSRALLMTAAIETVNRDENIKQNIATLKNTLSDTMDSIRESVHDLHDESIDLEANLRVLMKDFTFCEVKLDYTASPDIPREGKYCMLAVAKEALSNIAKHSNATEARITVRSHESMHQLMIEDNGTVSIGSDGKGIGLINIENRVKELSGTVYFSNANGFKVLITLPAKR